MEVLVARTVSELDEMAFLGQLIAGGTDLLVQLRSRPRPTDLVDLTNLRDGPPGVADLGDVVEISAVTPIEDIVQALRGALPGLAQAASVFASTQIRNRATLGGNLANASPAADLVPPLVAAGALLRLRRAGQERLVPISTFHLGPGRTALQPGEWIMSVRVPRPTHQEGFRKLGLRAAMAISIASLSWRWQRSGDGVLADVRVAVGAVAPTVRRCSQTESELEGKRLDSRTVERAVRLIRDEVEPIDDIRASAWYRRQMTGELLKEALTA
jgi:CO/xanthine dehydrogenase FAD-binding subunit